ncbi:energy transducer TonB [Novosphingobium sp. BL-52-GroH]|uniref:energy transducer TonB family protein n=1 Tax=Novosphingobium sp. BL-52-GroH TaxID=3349877 RepID=UPI00384B5978
MPSDADRVATGYQPGSPRQRLISTLLSAAIIVIALLIALYQTTVAPMRDKARNPVTFNVEGEDADSGQKSPEKAKQAQKEDKDLPKQDQVSVETPVTPVEKPPVPTEKPAFSFLKVSRSDMAAADIGAMKSPGSGSPSAGGGNSGSTYGPGEGPGGATLYNADWYKEPTDAQLGGYLPAKRPPEGWGMIACQTIEHYRVENCQILGESPRGSGFGRAVLNAAWQFQVLPPRINGKPQLGEWVRIRIDYGVRQAG